MERFFVSRDSHSKFKQSLRNTSFYKWPDYGLQEDEEPAGLRLLIDSRDDSTFRFSPSSSSPVLLIQPSKTVRKHSPYSGSSKNLGAVYNYNASPIQLKDHQSNLPAETRWSVRWRVLVGRIKEDYYRTYLAACDRWSVRLLKEEMNLKVRLMMNEVFIFRDNHVEMLSKQTFKREIWPPMRPTLLQPTAICVSISFLTVTGDMGGNINIYDAETQSLITTSKLDILTSRLYTGLGNEIQAERHAYPTHLTWLPRVSATVTNVHMKHGISSQFILGDSLGRVFVIALLESLELKILSFPKNPEDCRDTICGMSLSDYGSLLSVSSLDSAVSIWGIGHDPELQCFSIIQHPCVIRGLAFCPGMTSILATGGGRTDRCLRLIDVYTCTVLKTVVLPAQIVGVVWISRYEIFVALGHSRINGYRGYGKVYNILTDEIIANIPGTGYALTAVKTMTGFCINTSKHEIIQFDWAEDQETVCTKETILKAFGLATALPVLR